MEWGSGWSRGRWGRGQGGWWSRGQGGWWSRGQGGVGVRVAG